MSEWTHVTGCLRLSGVLSNIEQFEKDLPSILGKIVTYDEDFFPFQTDLPCGSEGSLRYKFHPNETGYLNFGQIFIWGDLRDYTDVVYIEKWLKEKTENFKNIGVSIRYGVLLVESSKVMVTFVRKDEDWWSYSSKKVAPHT